jgi:hypothetical protein
MSLSLLRFILHRIILTLFEYLMYSSLRGPRRKFASVRKQVTNKMRELKAAPPSSSHGAPPDRNDHKASLNRRKTFQENQILFCKQEFLRPMKSALAEIVWMSAVRPQARLKHGCLWSSLHKIPQIVVAPPSSEQTNKSQRNASNVNPVCASTIFFFLTGLILVMGKRQRKQNLAQCKDRRERRPLEERVERKRTVQANSATTTTRQTGFATVDIENPLLLPKSIPLF